MSDNTDKVNEIKQMINNHQERIEKVTKSQKSYIENNKKVAEELKELVSKLTECMNKLDLISKHNDNQNNEISDLKDNFTKQTEERNKELELEREQQKEAEKKRKEESDKKFAELNAKNELDLAELQKNASLKEMEQKSDAELAAANLRQQHEEENNARNQENDKNAKDAENALAKQKEEATATIERLANLNAEQKTLLDQQIYDITEESKKQLQEQKTKQDVDMENLIAEKDEIINLQKQQHEEALTLKALQQEKVIEELKKTNEETIEALKNDIAEGNDKALADAQKHCLTKQEELLAQITNFQEAVEALEKETRAASEMSISEVKGIVDQSCEKVTKLVSKIPDGAKEEEAQPQLKTEEAPVGPRPPFLQPLPEAQRRFDPAGQRLGEEATKYFRVPNKGTSINWITDWYDGIICLKSGKSCTPAEVVSNPKQYYYSQLVEAISEMNGKFTEAVYEKMHKNNSEQVYRYLLDKLGHYYLMDVGEHNMKMLMADWLVLYTEYLKKGPDVGEPNFEEYYSSESHRQWFIGHAADRVNSPEWPKWEKGDWKGKLSNMRGQLDNLGTPGAKHKYKQQHHRRGSKRGGFRYGMKIPRRRTLRSKMKTHRLKSKKKKKKKKNKSRKKQKRKKTAKK